MTNIYFQFILMELSYILFDCVFVAILWKQKLNEIVNLESSIYDLPSAFRFCMISDHCSQIDVMDNSVESTLNWLTGWRTEWIGGKTNKQFPLPFRGRTSGQVFSDPQICVSLIFASKKWILSTTITTTAKNRKKRQHIVKSLHTHLYPISIPKAI